MSETNSEIEIAVLKTEFRNLNDKIDGINTRLDALILNREQSDREDSARDSRIQSLEFKMNIVWGILTVVALAVINSYLNIFVR